MLGGLKFNGDLTIEELGKVNPEETKQEDT